MLWMDAAHGELPGGVLSPEAVHGSQLQLQILTKPVLTGPSLLCSPVGTVCAANSTAPTSCSDGGFRGWPSAGQCGMHRPPFVFNKAV